MILTCIFEMGWKHQLELMELMEHVQKRSSPKGIKQQHCVIYTAMYLTFFIFGRKKVLELEWQRILLHKEVTTAFGPCHPNWCFFRVLFCDEVDGANPANQLKCLKHWSLCRIFFGLSPFPLLVANAGLSLDHWKWYHVILIIMSFWWWRGIRIPGRWDKPRYFHNINWWPSTSRFACVFVNKTWQFLDFPVRWMSVILWFLINQLA